MRILFKDFFAEFTRLKLFLLIFIFAVCAILLSLWLGGFAATAVIVVPAILSILHLTKEVWTPEGGGKSKVGLASLGVAVLAIGAIHKWRPYIDSLMAPLYEKYTFLKDVLPSDSPSIVALVFLVLVILIVNYFARDKTAMKEHPTPIDKEFPEKGYKHHLKSYAGILLDDLNKIDRETNWSAEAFTPLDAEVEVQSGFRRLRKLTDLLSAIRSDHKSRAFLVLGDPGSGKSVALRKLCRDLLGEVEATGKLPIYVNLREWETHYQWTEDSPPTADALYDFVLNNLRGRGDVFANEFLDKYFKKMFENGRLFIVLDSFDEIPAVLDVSEGSWLIEALSGVIYKFLAGAHESRGILASRIFRRPTDAFAAKTTLEIRPFTESKIVETLKKSLFFDESLLNLLFNERLEFVPIARNPFTAALISSYAKEHNNMLPPNQAELYSSYIQRRLVLCDEKIKSKGLTEREVLDCATEIADVMLTTETFGLEAPVQDLSAKLPNHAVREVIDILKYARLGRLGGGDNQRFSFVHRRFNEYFVVKKLKAFPGRVPKDAIPTDSRWRDALVLYCEIAEEGQAREIAEYCWSEVRKIRDKNIGVSDPQYLRSVHCLRFLNDAFRTRLEGVSSFRDELGTYIEEQVAMAGDLISKKIAVEAVGLLKEADMDSILVKALDIGNAWITETALKSCRYLPKLSAALERRINMYIEMIDRVSFIKRPKEIIFSFSLSNAFQNVKRICIWQVIISYSTLAASLIIGLFVPFMFLVFLGSYLITKLAPYFFKRGATNASISSSQFLFPLTLVAGLSLLGGVVKYEHLPSYLKPILYVNLLPTSTNVLIPLLLFVFIFTVPWYLILLFISNTISTFRLDARKVFRGLKSFISYVLVLAILAGIYYIASVTVPNVVTILGVIPAVMMGAGMLISLIVIVIRGLFNTVIYIKNWLMDYMSYRSLVRKAFPERRQIGEAFNEFRTGFWRLKFARFLQSVRLKPTGAWPNGRIPNFENDRASTLLARLEEGWIGLDR